VKAKDDRVHTALMFRQSKLCLRIWVLQIVKHRGIYPFNIYKIHWNNL